MFTCSVCPGASKLRCSVCGTRYCSAHCQNTDWPEHKTACKVTVLLGKTPTMDTQSAVMALYADGNSAVKEGRLDDAIRLYTFCVQRASKDAGVAQPDCAVAYGALSCVYLKKGDADKALTAAEKQYDVAVACFGEDHPRLGPALFNASRALQRLGRLDEAVARQIRALAIQAARPDDVAAEERALALHQAGELQSEAGHLPEALEAYAEAEGIYAKLEGEERSLCTLLHAQGSVLTLMKRYDEAMVKFNQVMQHKAAAYGPAHPRLAATLVNMAHVHHMTGNTDASKAMYLEALAMSEQTLGDAHPLTVQCRAALGQVGGVGA